MGIKPRHAPVVAALKAGSLEIIRGDVREELAIGGGFVEIVSNHVIVMADVAEAAEEIDVERAERARERAAATLASAPEKVERLEALAELRRAEVRLRVARKRHGRGSARVGGE